MKNFTLPQENILKVLLLPALIPVIHPAVQNTFPHPTVSGSFGVIWQLAVCCGWCFQLTVPAGKCFGFSDPVCFITGIHMVSY